MQGGDESGAYGRPEERRGYRKKGHERGGYRRGSGRRKAYNKENDGGLAYRGDEAEEEEKIGGKVPERLLDCDYDPEKEDEGKIEKELKVNFDKAFERDENGRSYKKRRKHSRSRESSNDVTDAPAPEAKPDEPETSPSTPAESSSESPASAASPAGQSEQVNTRQERDNTGQAAGGGGDGSFESVDSLIARIRSHFQGDDPSLRAQPPEQFRITNETGNNSSAVAESGQVNQNGSQNGSLSGAVKPGGPVMIPVNPTLLKALLNRYPTSTVLTASTAVPIFEESVADRLIKQLLEATPGVMLGGPTEKPDWVYRPKNKLSRWAQKFSSLFKRRRSGSKKKKEFEMEVENNSNIDFGEGRRRRRRKHGKKRVPVVDDQETLKKYGFF